MTRAVLGLLGILLAAMFALTTVLPTPEADAQQGPVRIGVPGFGVFTIQGGRRARGTRKGGGQPQQPASGTNQDGDVEQIQAALAAFEFNPGAINGKMGQQTRNAISRYQKSLGERATGRLTEDQKDSLLNSYCVGSAPERNPTLESLFLVRRSEGGSSHVAPNPGQSASLRATCVRTFSSETSEETRKLLPDQFCVSRAYAMDNAARNIELRLEAQKQATREAIRAECNQRAEDSRARIALLNSLLPDELAKRLATENTVPEDGADLAVAQANICLGIGYADDRPDVALAAALDLIGLGETGTGELIAAHFALGAGVKRDVGRAVLWLDLAATEVQGGVSPAVDSDAACRWRVLRQMAEELRK
jgi:peptidoglycan hydrolase-like protein with peptidoglycan-binding domain